VTYIRTTPEKLWKALIGPEFTRQYWCETWQKSEWKPGSSWQIIAPDGRVADNGEVIEFDPPRRLVVTWRHELNAEMHRGRPFTLDLPTGTAGHVREIYADTRDGRLRLEADPGSVNRMATDPFQPQESARDWRVPGRIASLAEKHVIHFFVGRRLVPRQRLQSTPPSNPAADPAAPGLI